MKELESDTEATQALIKACAPAAGENHAFDRQSRLAKVNDNASPSPADIHYLFDLASLYQDAYGEMPVSTCIVPTSWLEKALPAFSGGVVYTDVKEDITGLVFEFSDLKTDGEARTISLDISCSTENTAPQTSIKRESYLDAPVKIHCRTLEAAEADWCIELVLLNHLFAPWNSTSIYGFCYYEANDLFNALSTSPEFIFEFGIGDTPEDIIPPMLERLEGCVANCLILSMFGDNESICSHHTTLFPCIEMVVNKFISFASAGYDENQTLPDFVSAPLFGDVGVKQEKMLISALVGCNQRPEADRGKRPL